MESIINENNESGDENDVYTIQKSDLNAALVDSTQNFEDLIAKENNDDEEEHLVKITINISAGFPAEEDFEKGDGKKLQEGLKPQNYYKFEYQLIPEENEPATVVDVVTYKIAAKLYPENQEPRLIKTWENESQIWVSWSQTHEIKITKDRLLKLFNHEFSLKIWDTKEFCQARTKFDKVKSIKFPSLKPDEPPPEDEIKKMVIKQCKSYLNSIPKEFHDKLDRPLPNQQKTLTKQTLIDPKTQSIQLTNTVIAMSTKPNANQRVGNKLTDLAADTELIKNDQQHQHQQRSSAMRKTPSSALNTKKSRSRQNDKSRANNLNEYEDLKQNGTRQIRVKFKMFFAGSKTVTARLESPSQRVEDCFITINLENNLMSDQQMELLNPFTIKIEKINDLPDKPVSFRELSEKCEPVYCTYQFCREPLYRTEGKSHAKSIYYNDVNVYLAGLMNQEEFREYLYGAPFEIEVHDRDRRLGTVTQAPCLFGNDASDGQISNVNAVATQNTASNPFETRNKLWDPYGVAKLNLYDFLLGKRLIQFFVPISPCSAPDSLGRIASSKNKTTPYSESLVTKANVNNHMLPGAYLDVSSCLYVTISLARPLESLGEIVSRTRAQMSRISTSKCVFGRIVFVIDYEQKNLVNMIFNLVKEINSRALNFQDMTESVRDAALSTYKLTIDEQTSKSLDIVTGFHVLDTKFHIIILEGLKDLSIREIFDRIPREKNDGIKFLYNSMMNFASRLYASLDVDLLRVKLFEPLTEIVKKPLLYVRDMAPKPSVDALIRLFQMLSIDRLRDITRCDIFPTAEMIVSMSREFGTPLTQNELCEYNPKIYQNEAKSFDKNINFDHDMPSTSKVWTPLDNTNEKYELEKQNREKSHKNFIKTNLESIQLLSEKNKIRKNENAKDFLVINGSFNYSSQKLNTTQLAIEQFRSLMQTDKGYYTYNPEFHHSMTFPPVTLEQAKEKDLQESKDKMVSYHKWTYPDVKSARQSNIHPKRPDSAIVETLKQPWIENLMHASKLKPTIERGAFKWGKRENDFDTWSKPLNDDNNIPVTIFDAGDIKLDNEKRISQSAKEIWQSKVVVDNLTPKVHRLLSSTEMITNGPLSCNQLDKLKGILKDEPMKKAFKTKANFNSIPSLNVLYDKKYEESENKNGYTPGDSFSLRITDVHNRIPIKSSNHEKYEKLNGKDFKVKKPERPRIHKRRIEPLNDEEKNRYLPAFVIANEKNKDKYEYQLVNGNLNLIQST